jgi:large subunit ribosomal protein L19
MIKAIIDQVQRQYMKSGTFEFGPGDTLRVNVKVTEKVRNDTRTRLQAYEGICIARRGSGINEEVVVRRVSHGTGVERTFPLHSPVVDSIEVLRHGDVRRAKLYYLRDRVGKSARVRERARRPKGEEEALAAKAAVAAAEAAEAAAAAAEAQAAAEAAAAAEATQAAEAAAAEAEAEPATEEQTEA